MSLLGEIAGEICRILLPIDDRIYHGNPSSNVAVCTLSSMGLLEELSGSPLMGSVCIAGRLLSENRGIDALVRTVLSGGRIRYLVLCGRDSAGHRAGHSLLCLHRNGVDSRGRIIGSSSPHPVLSLTADEVGEFQERMTIIDMTGETDLPTIRSRAAGLS